MAVSTSSAADHAAAQPAISPPPKTAASAADHAAAQPAISLAPKTAAQVAATPTQPTAAPPIYVPVVLQPTSKDEGHTWLSDVTSLVDAIAHAGWVILAILAVVLFRKEIRDLLKKIKKGNFLGNEVEFSDEVKELKDKAENLKDQVETAEPIQPVRPLDQGAEQEVQADKLAVERGAAAAEAAEHGTQDERNKEGGVQQWRTSQGKPDDTGMSTDAAMNVFLKDWLTYRFEGRPRYQSKTKTSIIQDVVLLTIGREIEAELKRAVARVGVLEALDNFSVLQAVVALTKRGIVLGEVIDSIELFNRVRDAIVHGEVKPSPDETKSAIESGQKILSALKSLPILRHVVTAVDIPLYSDAHGQAPLNVNGIQITNRLSKDQRLNMYILPTRRTDYKIEMEVTWEFDARTKWLETFYREPSTGIVKQAFPSSLEFVGRDITTI